MIVSLWRSTNERERSETCSTRLNGFAPFFLFSFTLSRVGERCMSPMEISVLLGFYSRPNLSRRSNKTRSNALEGCRPSRFISRAQVLSSPHLRSMTSISTSHTSVVSSTRRRLISLDIKSTFSFRQRGRERRKQRRPSCSPSLLQPPSSLKP